MKKLLFALTLYYCVILCSFANPEFILSDTGAIHGKVLDKNTGKPIPFADVFMGSKQSDRVKANRLGEFSFIGLEAGTYLLSAASDEYLTDFVSVEIGEDEVAGADIEMENNSFLLDADLVFN